MLYRLLIVGDNDTKFVVQLLRLLQLDHLILDSFETLLFRLVLAHPPKLVCPQICHSNAC